MKKRDEVFGVLFVVMLLLLTAWGNAVAMAVFSGIGCVVALAVLSRRTLGWRISTKLLACSVVPL